MTLSTPLSLPYPSLTSHLLLGTIRTDNPIMQTSQLMQTVSPRPSDCQSAPCGLGVRSLRTANEQEADYPLASFALSERWVRDVGEIEPIPPTSSALWRRDFPMI